jgi:magnesium transporter
VHDLPDEQAADVLEMLPPPVAADIFESMPSDDRVDVLADVQAENVEQILAAMEPRESAESRKLMEYPEDSAGGIMATEYLSCREHVLVGNMIEDLRKHRKTYSDFHVQYIYIITNNGTLSGVLPLRELILAAGELSVADIMIKNPLSVHVNDMLENLLAIFEEHQYLAVPVVDEQDRLIGVVRRDDVEEADAQRASDTFLKLSGVWGGEELRTMPLRERSTRRLSWLSINIVLNIISASVIAFHQDTLSAVIALAVFLPIISDMSGCSGNQAVAVSLRELALGLVRPRDLLRVLRKEFGIGILNGLALGLLLAVVTLLWKGNPFLGLVVGGAMALNTILAVALGGLLPLVLKRLNIDPALASGPILTTVTDMCGFLLLLGFASAMLTFIT